MWRINFFVIWSVVINDLILKAKDLIAEAKDLIAEAKAKDLIAEAKAKATVCEWMKFIDHVNVNVM